MRVFRRYCTPLLLALIVVIAFFAYLPSLQCFFYADDIAHFELAYFTLTRDFTLFWQGFTGPWLMNPPFGLYLRPLIDIAFIFDYLLWGADASGFHLVNVVIHALNALLVFFVARAMFSAGRNSGAHMVPTSVSAAFAALVFALASAQTETVYWIGCLCDLLAGTFGLCSLWLFITAIDSRSKALLHWLSAIMLALALMAKESALMVVPVLFILGLYLTRLNARGAFVQALRAIAPHVCVVVFYICWRLWALNGPGGFVGAIAADYSSWSVARIFASSWFEVIGFHTAGLTGDAATTCRFMLIAAYLFAGIGFAVALFAGKIGRKQIRAMVAPLLMAIVCCLPIAYPLMMSGQFFGSHYFHFPLVFFAIFAATIVDNFQPRSLRLIFQCAFVVILLVVQQHNGRMWVNLGNEMNVFRKGLVTSLSQTDYKDKIAVLNYPWGELYGSSVFDLEQLRCYSRPPISGFDYSNRLVSPTRLSQIRDEYNQQRLAEVVRSGANILVFNPGTPHMPLKKPSVPPAFLLRDNLSMPLPVVVDSIFVGNDAKIPALRFDLRNVDIPQQADVIEMVVAPRGQSASTAIKTVRSTTFPHYSPAHHLGLLWRSTLGNNLPDRDFVTTPFEDDGKAQRHLFYVGQRTSWKFSDQLKEMLLVRLPDNYQLQSVRLLGRETLVPTISFASDCQTDLYRTEGTVVITPQPLIVEFDCSKVAGAMSAVVEITSYDSPFFFSSGTLRDITLNKYDFRRIETGKVKGSVTLHQSDFKVAGHYQVRVAAIDTNGAVVGFTSDAVQIASEIPYKGVLNRFFATSRPPRR
jgi:hypothetical protein